MEHLTVGIMAAYPVIHGLATVLSKYLPDPGEAKSGYSAFYHALQWFALGNGPKAGQ